MPSFGAFGAISGIGGLNSGSHTKMRMRVCGVASSSKCVGIWTGPNSGSPEFAGSSLDMAVAEKTGPNFGGIMFNSQDDKVKQRWLVSGITKDSTGAPLGNCIVQIFNTNDDSFICEVLSGELGQFEITLDGNVQTKYMVAYKAGGTDVAGTTVNTILPILT